MMQGILITIGYLIISFILDLLILGSIGNRMKKADEQIGIPAEDRNASPLFIVLSTARICGLFYLINFIYKGLVPVLLFIALGVLEIMRGTSQMLKHDNMGMPHIRNYFTAKTIGSFIGLSLMAYWTYFK